MRYSTSSALHQQHLEQMARRERERKVERELQAAYLRRRARRLAGVEETTVEPVVNRSLVNHLHRGPA